MTPGLAILVNEARVLAPVDTGRLRASIGSKTGEGIYEINKSGSQVVGRIGSKVVYASYQEYGTRFQSGKPYMRPAVERKGAEAVKKIEEGIDKVLKRLGLKD